MARAGTGRCAGGPACCAAPAGHRCCRNRLWPHIRQRLRGRQKRQWCWVGVALVSCSTSSPPPLPPTQGMDYNVTLWHSPSSMSANHWEAAAKACEAYCLNDPQVSSSGSAHKALRRQSPHPSPPSPRPRNPQCITWTYCTPEVGSKDPERCCLKNGIPQEVEVATHWTGAAPRAKNWTQPMPKIHFSPQCLHEVCQTDRLCRRHVRIRHS